MMEEILHMEVPGDPDYIGIVKMAAGSAASIKGFTIDKVEDIRMAVGEVCKTITCHNFMEWSAAYRVSMDMDDETMVIKVEDSKEGHQIDKDLSRRPCLDCPKEGDLGVHIIKTVTDDMEVIKSGDGLRCIRMVFNK